ncbi:MAG TPA: DegT/DnrJ/EryC1/StrS family aminotransferase [Acidimicrobiales bacterium]|nr:DegT/DnrJ/EryC1/StrS family aminotransferase [Acidimicrobiales bacterium]
MTERRIDIASPVTGDEEWTALRGSLESGWLTQGPRVAEFERLFAEYQGVPYAKAVTSCTTGMHLALRALGIGPGDEVIVPAFTWVATANVVIYCGATPVFVDVDPVTYNLDPTKLVDALSDRTKAVMAVHLFGLCADIDAIRAVVPDDVDIVEDAACAIGASYRGRPAGGLGRLGVFSFHPRKVITTGEGGMVTTAEEELAEVVEALRNHGASLPEEVRHVGSQPWLLPDFDLLGYNYRMTDLQGSVGIAQMARLDGLLAERRHWAEWYSKALGEVAWLRPPVVPEGYVHGWQSYVVVVDESAPAPRNELMEQLHRQGVSTRPGTHAVPDLGWYRRELGTSMEAYPAATWLRDRSMAIPLHNRMDDHDFERVVDALISL